MEISKITNRKKDDILNIVIFLAFFVTDDILIFGTFENTKFRVVQYSIQIVLFLGLFFYVVLNKKIFSVTRCLRTFFLLVFFILASAIINGDLRMGYIFMIMVYGIAVLLLQITNYDKIFSVFYSVMVFICTYSLIFYFVRLLNLGVLNYFPIIRNSSGIRFYFGIFSNATVAPDVLLRNYGPFREPGVFQMFIIISLVYGLFKKNDSNIIRILTQFAALITTFSTTAYISMFFLIVALMNYKQIINKRLRRIIIFVLIVFIGYLALGTDLLFKKGYGSVFGKLFGGYESSSTNARIASIVLNFKIFLENPIFGKGLSYVDDNFKMLALNEFGYLITHNTNTVFIQLARFGLFYALIFVCSYYYFIKNYFPLKRFPFFCILASIFVLLVGENLTYSFAFSLFLFGAKENMIPSEVPLSLERNSN